MLNVISLGAGVQSSTMAAVMLILGITQQDVHETMPERVQ